MEPNRELKQAVIDYQNGKVEAFTTLYEESQRYVYVCIQKILKDCDNLSEVVSDVMQDTYTEISRNISQLERTESFLNWAGSIATRQCYAYLKKNRRQLLSLEEGNALEKLVVDEELIPEAVMQDREKQRLIRKIIDTELTPMQRLCIIAFYYNEQKQSEIARDLGIPENTVKTHLSRSKAKIKEGIIRLEKKEGTKLYSVEPLLLLLLKEEIRECVVPAEITKSILAVSVGAKSGISAGTKVAAGVKGAAGKGVATALKVKIAAAVIGACALLAVGVGIFLNQRGQFSEQNQTQNNEYVSQQANNSDMNGNSDTNNDTNLSSDDEFEMGADRFSFIYDLDKLTDEGTNFLDEEDKYLIDLRWGSKIGNPHGQLHIRPVGFSENVKVWADYYKLTVKSNKFLIPQKLEVISYNSGCLYFYILGNDWVFYNVQLDIDSIPHGIELTQGSWHTEFIDLDNCVNAKSYYQIDDDYCLRIDYMFGVSEEVMRELVDKVTTLITFEKISDTEDVNIGIFSVELDEIKLDENIAVRMDRLVCWHSGAEENYSSIFAGDSVVNAENTSGNWTYVTEFSKDKDMDEYLSYLDMALKEYSYHGRDIYIGYYTDESNDFFNGKYIGIFFEVDGILYEVAGGKAMDPSEIDVDTWISTMCDGVISI
ncbi:MAG: sigma-70 family RNA polymerase sigma factor [Acetatifactor sp.]|nr:sigma-70 family RNA polymerase sigma factor [Acetatifactor sp.]